MRCWACADSHNNYFRKMLGPTRASLGLWLVVLCSHEAPGLFTGPQRHYMGHNLGNPCGPAQFSEVVLLPVRALYATLKVELAQLSATGSLNIFAHRRHPNIHGIMYGHQRPLWNLMGPVRQFKIIVWPREGPTRASAEFQRPYGPCMALHRSRTIQHRLSQPLAFGNVRN